MVAYSFHKIFASQVEGGLKRQTVRRQRKRHARPGEAIQLYTAMRTRWCRKLVWPDPFCTQARGIEIIVPEGVAPIEGIAIDGIALDPEAMERFAIDDGFEPRWHTMPGRPLRPEVTALDLMTLFWRLTHGAGRFEGVLVQWGDGDGR